MPEFRFDAMTATGEEITDVMTADSRRAAGQALAARGLFVTRLVERDAQEEEWEEPAESSAADKPDAVLAEFGWVIEPSELGITLRRSGVWYAGMAGCSTMLLLPVIALAYGFGFGRGFPQKAFDGGSGAIISWGIAILMNGVFGFLMLIGILHVLRFALLREVWQVSRSLLIIRRSVLGLQRDHEYRAGAFVLEPHYGHGEQSLHWRLVLHHDGCKRFLITRPLSFLSQSTADSLAECRGLATLLAAQTGWNLSTAEVGVESLVTSPSTADDQTLIATLRRQGCRIGDDAHSALVIVPPQWGRRCGGLLLAMCGAIWVWLMSDVIVSFTTDRDASRSPIMHIPFWLIMTPMLLVGVAVFAGGLSLLFAGQRWKLDRNSLRIHIPWVRWKPVVTFVDVSLRLKQVVQADTKGHRRLTWQLQLHSPSGTLLRVLVSSSDDDLPRLLGTLISHRTGWPMSENDAPLGATEIDYIP